VDINFLIEVHGIASGKVIKFDCFSNTELDMSLMIFLQSKNIPIASTCLGEGVCKKCVVNDDMLSCQIKVRELINGYESLGKRIIKIDYY
jgi:hypothetical protein